MRKSASRTPNSVSRRGMLLGGLAGAGALCGGRAAAQTGPASDLRAQLGPQKWGRSVLLDGVEISYSDTGGRKPTLVCLHAIGHGARDFEGLSGRLAPQFRVIAIDWPGQGRSGVDAQPACGTRYAQLLASFVERLGLRDVVLLGNSIGGAAAVRFASLHPARVKALVMCDSGGLGPPPTGPAVGFIENFARFFESGAKGDPAFGPAFQRYYEKVLIEPPAWPERDRIIRAAYETAPVLAQAWHSFARADESLWEMTPHIECPVFCAWAKDDSVLPLEPLRPALERFPNHQLEVFPGGHAVFLEDPEQFETSLRRYLRALPA